MTKRIVHHLCLLLSTLCVVLTLSGALRSFAAPAPLARKHSRSNPEFLCGRWDLEYAGIHYDAVFHPSGHYEAKRKDVMNNCWEGKWSYDPIHKELWVRETNGRQPWLEWWVILDSYLSGKWGEIDVKLTRPKVTD